MAKPTIAQRNRAVGMLQTDMLWRGVVRRLTHVIRPFYVSGHYFSKQLGDVSERPKTGRRGSWPLHKTGKFSYVFLI